MIRVNIRLEKLVETSWGFGAGSSGVDFHVTVEGFDQIMRKLNHLTPYHTVPISVIYSYV